MMYVQEYYFLFIRITFWTVVVNGVYGFKSIIRNRFSFQLGIKILFYVKTFKLTPLTDTIWEFEGVFDSLPPGQKD